MLTRVMAEATKLKVTPPNTVAVLYPRGAVARGGGATASTGRMAISLVAACVILPVTEICVSVRNA